MRFLYPYILQPRIDSPCVTLFERKKKRRANPSLQCTYTIPSPIRIKANCSYIRGRTRRRVNKIPIYNKKIRIRKRKDTCYEREYRNVQALRIMYTQSLKKRVNINVLLRHRVPARLKWKKRANSVADSCSLLTSFFLLLSSIYFIFHISTQYISLFEQWFFFFARVNNIGVLPQNKVRKKTRENRLQGKNASSNFEKELARITWISHFTWTAIHIDIHTCIECRLEFEKFFKQF